MQTTAIDVPHTPPRPTHPPTRPRYRRRRLPSLHSRQRPHSYRSPSFHLPTAHRHYSTLIQFQPFLATLHLVFLVFFFPSLFFVVFVLFFSRSQPLSKSSPSFHFLFLFMFHLHSFAIFLFLSLSLILTVSVSVSVSLFSFLTHSSSSSPRRLSPSTLLYRCLSCSCNARASIRNACTALHCTAWHCTARGGWLCFSVCTRFPNRSITPIVTHIFRAVTHPSALSPLTHSLTHPPSLPHPFPLRCC